MTPNQVVMTRLKWYGCVIGATVSFIWTAGTKGLDAADFLAGFLAATLAMPFILRDSQGTK